jgi:adenylate cyclase
MWLWPPWRCDRFLDELKSRSYRTRVWEIHIGIHTGPVTATANGKKRISWELKGDTVNIASRLCSSCEERQINISANTYELVKEFFTCEYQRQDTGKIYGRPFNVLCAGDCS